MRYHEYAGQPFKRNATFIPTSALLDFYSRPDSGYCSVYQFDAHAVAAIRAQGDSTGMGRFSVYSDRLWIDLDAADSSPAAKEKITAYAREVTKQLQSLGLKFSIWSSGSKGFHIAVKITPMTGRDVPYSQLQFVKEELKIQCDYSLYQHARLLSNPGRVHPTTGLKKTKLYEFDGGILLTIPILPAPIKPELDSNSLTSVDLVRIGFHRLASLAQDSPLPGMRHQQLWSCATQLLESGMDEQLVFGNLCFINRQFNEPKTEEEVQRCVTQAMSQLR